ncbi:MAG: hypothetical protein WCQ99_15070, partial [Pseudomonadota bacterium]
MKIRNMGKGWKGKNILAKELICTALVLGCVLLAPPKPLCAQKIGILFSHVGQTEDYRFDWIPQFFDPLYDIFPPGLFAGGRFEGGNCYTLIHYANEVEADICKVEKGTPVDALCNTYTGQYPVHSFLEHSPFVGDGTYHHSCYPLPNPFFPLTFGDTTSDPRTGSLINGPHVDDPDAAGKGIIDFYELISFAAMKKYHALPRMKNFHRKHALKFWYGNAVPAYYGYD